jgi:hypothetical protein
VNNDDLLTKSKDQYAALIEKIQSTNSAVGIDAQYTHAVIISYLQRIDRRLTALEEKLK